jgi:hypothetical protein
MEKKVVDGKVGILVSPRYGAGWSTWNTTKSGEPLLFDPVVVEMVENKKAGKAIFEYCKNKYPNAYLGGVDGLEVVWIPQGTRFRITEYDGAEELETIESIEWEVA